MNAKNIIIVESPFYAFFNYDQWNYAYSCAYYAAVVKQHGHSAYIYDADKYFEKDVLTKNRLTMVNRQRKAEADIQNADHTVWKHYRKVLLDLKPDVVLFSTWTFKIASIDKCIAITKEILPDVRIAVGGYHATAMPETYTGNPLVDCVFIGPAEQALPEWLAANCPPRVVNTKVCKENFVLDIHPDRSAFLFPECFSNADFNLSIFSRGCNHNCAFCQNAQLTCQRHIYASPEYIEKELSIIKDYYGNKHGYFADAHFYDDKNAYSILEIIKKSGLTWGCALRIDALSERFLDALQDAGCVQLFCGIERGSNAALRSINKKITVEQIRNAAKMIQATSLLWRSSFIIGFPDETYQSIEDTKTLALSLGCDYVSLNSFTPLPGTILWDALSKKFGSEFLLRGYNQLNPKANFIESIDEQEYIALFKATLAEFEAYNDEKRLHKQGVFHIA